MTPAEDTWAPELAPDAGAETVPDARWIALTALSVLFGMQALRALVPLAVFMLRDRFGWHAGSVGLAMMALLATGFLASPARRVAGSRRFLWVAAGGLGLARLGQQAWTGDPALDLGLTAVAAVCFFFALPALATGNEGRVAGGAGFCFALGWLIGLAFDTALHGAYGTWDMAWRSDPATLVTILGLVALQGWLLAGATRRAGQPAGAGDFDPGWPWIGLGPLLFLELLILGNVARLSALTGWGSELAGLSVLAGRIAACAVVATATSFGRRVSRPEGLVLALLFAMVVAWRRGAPAAWLLFGMQVLAGLLWAWIALAASERTRSLSASRAALGLSVRPPSVSPGSSQRLATSHGVALLAFGVLLFLYYGGIDIRLPFDQDLLPLVAAFALGLAAIAAAGLVSPPARVRLGYSWLALAVLLAPALIRLGAAERIRAGDEAGFPLRIMTYNLHLGIDPRGHLGLEQIAQTIEAEDPDVVALQEVSRGWVIGGTADTLTWLSRRLGMPYVFAGTADPLWGNAVLSRRPFLRIKALDLPTEELLIRRGLLVASIDAGAGGSLEVMVTHHHHKRDGGAVRELQSRAVLDYWQGARRTVILGDFNARPGAPEIETLRAAGLRDVLALAGVEPGYTNPSVDPVQRIDYIWISPDLTASEVVVPRSQASDHLPVVATLSAP